MIIYCPKIDMEMSQEFCVLCEHYKLSDHLQSNLVDYECNYENDIKKEKKI